MKKLLFCLGIAYFLTPISVRAAGPTPTFNKDVAPIFNANCVSCHRPGEIAPMSLLSYDQARPWARSIKSKVVARQMPPWFADPKFGAFRNGHGLTQVEIDTVAAWVDGGAPQGSGQAPTAPALVANTSGFMSRPADYVIEMPVEIPIPAEGEVPNFTVWGRTPFTEDKFLEAVELRPSNRAVTHHSSAGSRALPPNTTLGRGPAWFSGPLVDAVPVRPDGKPLVLAGDVNEAVAVAAGSGRAAPAAAQARGEINQFANLLLFYVPGGGHQRFPDGAAKRIRANDLITWGLHYTTTGKPETDRHALGLWYQPNVRHEVITTSVTDARIVEGREFAPEATAAGGAAGRGLPNIPSYADDWKITGIKAVRDDMTLYGLWPHMHLRGKDMTFFVVYPDGREETILHVPKYDFNWQLQYEFASPIKLPAGSTIRAVAHYDNSTKNRYNPAPEKDVYWSEQSWDEMFLPFLELSIDKDAISSGNRAPTTAQQQQPRP